MRKLIGFLILLYVVTLHLSIAGMEIASTALVLAALIYRVLTRRAPNFAAWPLLTGLTAVVAVTLVLNEPLKPFVLQLGFMRWVVLLWLFAAALEDVWDEAFERRLITTWMTTLSIVSAYALAQFLFGVDVLRASHHVLERPGLFYRATGSFSNSLTFTYVVGTSFFAVTGAYLARSRFKYKWAIAGLSALVTVTPMVRGALLAAIGSGGSYVALARRRLIPYFAGAVGALVFAMALVSPKLMAILQGKLEHSSSERVHLWRAYGQMFLDHPFKGVGLFQGDRLLPEYYQRLGIDEVFTSHAHNVLIQWAAGTGLFGLLLYVAISCYFLRLAWRLRLNSPWGWSLVLAQIYWHLGGLTEANFFDGEVTHVITFTWALVVVLTRRHGAKR